jgi:hypothetical protein
VLTRSAALYENVRFREVSVYACWAARLRRVALGSPLPKLAHLTSLFYTDRAAFIAS